PAKNPAETTAVALPTAAAEERVITETMETALAATPNPPTNRAATQTNEVTQGEAHNNTGPNTAPAANGVNSLPAPHREARPVQKIRPTTPAAPRIAT